MRRMTAFRIWWTCMSPTCARNWARDSWPRGAVRDTSWTISPRAAARMGRRRGPKVATTMFRSIRWTLQLWHAAILTLALLSFASALYMAVARTEFNRIDAELQGAA